MHKLNGLKGVLVLGLALAMTAQPAPATRAQGSTAVSVLPSSGNYAVGAQVQVEVWVEDVTGLYGADIQLSFDPARMQVLDADAGTNGVQVAPRDDLLAPDSVLIKSANNVSGTVQYVVTQINPTPPASGSGALFAFTVQMISAGPASLTITNKQLSTQGGNPIEAAANHASYVIGTAHKVYVPLFRR